MTYFPGHSGYGSDEFGDFIAEPVEDTVRNNDGSIDYTYDTKYADFTVRHECHIDDIEGGAGSGHCNYDVIEGADAKEWSGTDKTGVMRFGLARETGDGSSKGLIASSEPAAFQYEFKDSNTDESHRITFNCPSFTRFPKYSGDCTSNFGAVTISGQDETPVLPNVPVEVEYDFTEAGFSATMTDTRTSLGESVAGHFTISGSSGAPFGNGQGTYGGVAKVGGDASDVSTEKFISTPTNFYYKTTVTGNDGTVKVINKSELGAVLFPKNEGSGEDDYLGAYKSVQLTESNASGVTKQKQMYENGEWAEFAYTTEAVGNTLTFTGDYVDSKGLVGTYVSEVTRDEDPITAQYDSMRQWLKQTVKAFGPNGEVVDATIGEVNLNLGQGTPEGTGTSAQFGDFKWTSESAPEIDYTAGTMTLRTRRNYEGWHQDYTYDLPFPIGGVNVFTADVTSAGANKPNNVPASSQVLVVAEEVLQTGEEPAPSFLSETDPTDAEALFTNDNGDEYKLSFTDYQRFAGFNSDGSTKVAGTTNVAGLGSVSLVTGDYSTVADGYYTETMTINGTPCTITYRPTGGPAMDESGDYESNCPGLANGSWKSAKGTGASLDKYVEEETRVDDVSTRKCGTGPENAKCKDRKITGTMTTVYFPRVEGHGTDDYHGKFKRYALADTTFQGENTKIIEYDDGFTTRNVYTLQVKTITRISTAKIRRPS